MDKVQKGDIMITTMTDPDWVPIMKRASGIITNQGGRTCHAAIVSRELNIPAIVGTEHCHEAQSRMVNILPLIVRGARLAISMMVNSTFNKETVELTDLPKPLVPIMLNLADPERAFALSFLPVAGVGLARIEFIITNTIKIHPLALFHPELVTDKKAMRIIEQLTAVILIIKHFILIILSARNRDHCCGILPKAGYCATFRF